MSHFPQVDMASRGKRKVDIVSESSASNTAKPPIGKSGNPSARSYMRTTSYQAAKTQTSAKPQELGQTKKPVQPATAATSTRVRSNSFTGGCQSTSATQKPKATPSTVSTASASTNVRDMTVVRAALWRGRCKVLGQREKFEKETQLAVAKLRSATAAEEETQRRTAAIKEYSENVASLQLALTLLDMQTPRIHDLGEQEPELQKKIELFTKALKQFVSCVMVVDTRTVKLPKTDPDIGLLLKEIEHLISDLISLAYLLGTNRADGDAGRGTIFNAANNFINSTELFFLAFAQMNEHDALVYKARRNFCYNNFIQTFLTFMVQEKMLPR